MSPRRSRANCRSKVLGIPQFLLWILLAVAVVAIVVPLAVMFGKKKGSPPHATVLVPLYVYPSPGAWDPLFTAVARHPTLNFTVVVNPASGPGGGTGPDGNYTRDIPRLNSYANVRTVGYVSTSWTNREISLALQDIKTYSAWSQNATAKGLGMQGIFLDETPAQWTADSAEFLETIASAIRSETGFGSDPLIIHNPGTIPDARFLASCNLSVVFEGTYSTYQIYGFHKTISAFQASSKCERSAIACIVHDLPASLSNHDENSLVRDLRSVAGSIFVTGLSVDYYASFWEGWDGFARDMAA